MGLDMYLKQVQYIPHFPELAESNPRYKEELVLATKILELVDAPIEKDGGSVEVSVTVMYWRKANQIHNWFVTNVQDGKDDCGEYEVSYEQLIELRTLCQKVLKNHDLAGELLPTTSGFFFGSTEIDEWFFKDLEYTVAGIDKLTKPEGWERWFEYRSSW